MSTSTSGITEIRTVEFDGGLIVRARSAHDAKVVQCYVAGELVDWQSAPAEAVEFVLAGVDDCDVVFLLAVDPAEAEVCFWAEAFGTPADRGNRIVIETPRTLVPYLPGDRWRVSLGNTGDAQADAVVWEQPFYPAGRRACGWGAQFGGGGFGFDGVDAAGFGGNFGVGEYGFDCEMLSWRSDPMPPGTYPYEAAVVDEAGNVSAATAGTITLDTFARCASALAVQSYDKATDTLTLSFSPSEDLN